MPQFCLVRKALFHLDPSQPLLLTFFLSLTTFLELSSDGVFHVGILFMTENSTKKSHITILPVVSLYFNYHDKEVISTKKLPR